MKVIDELDFEIACAKPENQSMIKWVCRKYSGKLSPDVLKLCGDIGLWRCLQSHKDGMGNKFTSSLHQFVKWECLRELNTHNRLDTIGSHNDELIPANPTTDYIIVNDYLELLKPKHRQMVEARFLSGHTLAEVGEMFGYSKAGAKNVIDRSIKIMREAAQEE